MIVIIDDVLSDDELELSKNQFIMNEKTDWVDMNLNTIMKLNSAFGKIMRKVNNHFDLSSMVGCEIWSHHTTRPDWHFDKDENSNEKTGELIFPICSIVFYPFIKNLVGGRLLTGTEQILPKTNRLIAFSPGIYHTVEPFQGERLSIAINPWDHVLEK